MSNDETDGEAARADVSSRETAGDGVKQRVGTIGWIDLTVPDADGLRDFYSAVVGWSSQPLSMGDYADHVMTLPDGAGVAGICHRRGANEAIPAVWLIYIVVADLDASLKSCRAQGGEVVAEPKRAGDGRYAIIRDPAGVVCALYEDAAPTATK